MILANSTEAEWERVDERPQLQALFSCASISLLEQENRHICSAPATKSQWLRLQLQLWQAVKEFVYDGTESLLDSL